MFKYPGQQGIGGIIVGNVYYAPAIESVKKSLRDKNNLSKMIDSLESTLIEQQTDLVNHIEAQKLLSSLSDKNTNAILGFITGVINKALSEIFPNKTRMVRLTKKLYAGSRPHIVAELVNEEGIVLDMEDQAGTGLCQVVSFLFEICIIEIRKGRRLVLSDERLSGLHKHAKKILGELIQIFEENGFQFIFVEYALNDIGKIYNIESKGDHSVVVSLGDGEEYDDSKIYLSDEVDLSVVDKDYVDDCEDVQSEVLG